MVAYVTIAGLDPEPKFALLCRSFFRWSILVLQRHAYLLFLYISSFLLGISSWKEVLVLSSPMPVFEIKVYRTGLRIVNIEEEPQIYQTEFSEDFTRNV